MLPSAGAAGALLALLTATGDPGAGLAFPTRPAPETPGGPAGAVSIWRGSRAQPVAASRSAVSDRDSDAITVAVLDLAVVDNSALGDSKQLAAWFREQQIDPTELLRAEIVKPETYAALAEIPTVVSVDGARLEAALSESGVPPGECATDCAIAVGRAVGADRVVTGEVTKISNLIWFVTAGVVDVHTGRVLRRDEFEVKGVIQDMLPRVMASLSRRFVAAGSPPAS